MCCAFRASYCEIYNEALYDLLKFTKQQLQVRWDSSKGFYVPELAVKECNCVEDMLQVTMLITWKVHNNCVYTGYDKNKNSRMPVYKGHKEGSLLMHTKHKPDYVPLD